MKRLFYCIIAFSFSVLMFAGCVSSHPVVPGVSEDFHLRYIEVGVDTNTIDLYANGKLVRHAALTSHITFDTTDWTADSNVLQLWKTAKFILSMNILSDYPESKTKGCGFVFITIETNGQKQRFSDCQCNLETPFQLRNYESKISQKLAMDQFLKKMRKLK